jgi:Methyltransferase FkbM domain
VGGLRWLFLGQKHPVRAVTIDEIIKEFGLGRIDLLKIDVEGSEKEIFDNSEAWISSVDVICVELHDRFKAGCSRSFFTAVTDFTIELRRNEDVLVARPDSPLAPITQW